MKPKIHYHIHMSPPLGPILNQSKPAQTSVVNVQPVSLFFWSYFNIILPSTPLSYK